MIRYNNTKYKSDKNVQTSSEPVNKVKNYS